MAGEVRSGDAVFTFDEELRILSWNAAAEELTGIPADEAVGRHCWEVLCGVDEQGAIVCHRGCSGARLLRQGWPLPAKELLIKTAGGRRRVMMSSIAIRNEGGPPLFIHLMRDGVETPDQDSFGPEAGAPKLTRRQLEVLRLLGEGEPAKVIARRLEIAEATVRNHIRMILLELGCHSQLEAVAEARRRKLIP
jgi:PAS domain S-box-containing protein